MSRKKILVIDDDLSIQLTVKHNLKEYFECHSALNLEEARVLLKNKKFDLALLDINLGTEENGIHFLPEVKELDPELDIIIVSSSSNRDHALKATELGASGYLLKDHPPIQLLITIESILRKKELAKEIDHLEKDRKRSLLKSPIIGNSQKMKNLLVILDKVSATANNVLIYGQTGTGKELVARHIGGGSGKPFVAVDSSTITSSMAESLLFGHEKGAFTGAVSASKGLFEEADGGTIYFDEIGNMPLEIQRKLLRVLQEKEITRVGSRRIIPLEFRVIAATNRNLEELSQKGEFLYDLFQRVSVIPIELPGLSERKEDIPALCKHLLEKNGKADFVLSSQCYQALQNYTWPGNVRELANVIAYLCTMITDRKEIEVEDLPSKILRDGRVTSGSQAVLDSSSTSTGISSGSGLSSLNDVAALVVEKFNSEEAADFYSMMNQLEGMVLSSLYKKHSGNMSQFSKAIKVSRSHLYSKLNSHGIH